MKKYIDRDEIINKLTDIKRDTDSNFVYSTADTIKEFVEAMGYISIEEHPGEK